MPGIKINKYHSVAAARRRALTYNNINNNNACACHRQRERDRERVASARGRTVPGLSARQIEDHHRSKSAFATKLIVKLPLIMFCVLWLVHMIDSPLHLPSLHYSPFPSLYYTLVLSVKQNKSFRFTRLILLPFYVQSTCLAALPPPSPSLFSFSLPPSLLLLSSPSFVYMHKKQKRIFIQSTRPSTSLIDSFGLIKSREASTAKGISGYGIDIVARTITLWH